MPLKLHASQYIDPHTGEISPKDWEATMDPDEVKWCWLQIHDRAKMIDEENGEKIYGECLDGFRAARMWKSSQRRRFVRLRTCCGSCEWVKKRWSWRKVRWDYYWLGFNYGH
jgi:hypothetical protein